MADEHAIALHWGFIMKELGLDLDNDNFRDTPERVAKSLIQICSGLYDTDNRVAEIMKTRFPSSYDEMIVEKGIDAVGMCPHHFLTIQYDIVVGYIPSSDGYVLGLSKIPRLVVLLAARPILQEELAMDISYEMGRWLSPLGVGVVVDGSHGCMTCRGVKMRDARTITAKMTGVFKDDPVVRREFMSYYQNNDS